MFPDSSFYLSEKSVTSGDLVLTNQRGLCSPQILLFRDFKDSEFSRTSLFTSNLHRGL